MKRFFFITIISLVLPVLLSACISSETARTTQTDRADRRTFARYNIILYEVERNGEIMNTAMPIPGVYEDDQLAIAWVPLGTEFSFNLQNKSSSSMKIIWDEAVYVDESGSSDRVIHAGVRLMDRYNPQPPTVIARYSSVEDIVVPVDKIHYSSGKYGGWRTDLLLESAAPSPEEMDVIANGYVGHTIKILLPLQVGEKIDEYLFTFKIDSYTRID
jgi:hypothetical protein